MVLCVLSGTIFHFPLVWPVTSLPPCRREADFAGRLQVARIFIGVEHESEKRPDSTGMNCLDARIDSNANTAGTGELPAVKIFDLFFSLADYQGTCDRLIAMAAQPGPKAAAFCATHLLAESRLRDDFRQVLSTFELRMPDGMPVVWLINAVGGHLQDRVYGPYLMRHVILHAPATCRHFLFGGSTECLAQLNESLRKLRPDIRIVGSLSPPFRPWLEEDEAEFARAIAAADPDFIWVGLGGIKQERWVARNRHRYRRGVFLAVGDAFELLAGRRTFAPAWMQRLGLTWVFRLYQEPRRLWKRYLVYNSVFTFYALLDVIGAIFSGRRRRNVAGLRG